MKQLLSNYNLNNQQIPILCDNTSAINLTKTIVMHSKTKHIQICHHFIRDHIQRDDISLKFIQTVLQFVDIFTKPFDGKQFVFVTRELSMFDPSKNNLQYLVVISYIFCDKCLHLNA